MRDDAVPAADTTYRGIHAGVTKSGVKKEENASTRLSAADCSGDGTALSTISSFFVCTMTACSPTADKNRLQ